MRFFFFSFLILVSLSSAAFAQMKYVNAPKYLETTVVPLILPHAQHAGQQRAVYLKTNLDDPVIPQLEALNYKNPEPSKTIEAQIDALLFGINSYIDPTFDMYGYEVRRYMADVMTPSKLNNPVDVLESYKNIRRARIVLNNWKGDMSAELERLNVAAEGSASASRMSSKITYASNIINQFFEDLDGGVSANENMVVFLFNNQGEFEAVYPLYYFINFTDQEAFLELYIEREKALATIQAYLPFTKMVY